MRWLMTCAWWTAAVGVLLVVAGCASAPATTISERVAGERIDSYVRETLRMVYSPLRFSRVRDGRGEGCAAAGFGGQVEPSVFYRASTIGLRRWEVRRFAAATVAYWQSAGAGIERMENSTVIHLRDHYRLAVAYYPAARRVEIRGVLNECIWPKGTAPAEAR
ncbi:hypothetical protein [Streptosporangium carneum]|uniref:Lipoprotein n=1 Tax=Streptosporangium carneum TaxID=47481 RepID=A0A9W6HZJ6_9ACTN|nr:hypothetical protein [Streptosporangium carneum]GLK08691.1 hypothetical protein GCM10017600_20960 [Streptosporangium carneum]